MLTFMMLTFALRMSRMVRLGGLIACGPLFRLLLPIVSGVSTRELMLTFVMGLGGWVMFLGFILLCLGMRCSFTIMSRTLLGLLIQ